MEGTIVQRRSPKGPRMLIRALLALVAAWSATLVLAQGGREAIVADVVIKGNQSVPTEQILRYIYTKPGREYSTTTAQGDVERLATSGLFQRPPRMSDATTADGRVVVTFDVQEHTTVVRDVIFKHANHIPEKELEQMVRIR